MVERRAFLAVFMATALTGSATAASAAQKSVSSPVANGTIVAEHIPDFDGPMTMLSGSDGRTWAAWTFRASHEFDIAVTSLEQSTATWSAPVFFGRRSGSDEVDPAIAVDSRGVVYLAFAMTNPPRVAVATLAVGSATWSEPLIVSGTAAASSPSLLIVGDRLVVAYRTARGVGMVELPTLGGGNHLEGIQDGPEGIDPLGVKGEGVRANPPTPASSTTPLP